MKESWIVTVEEDENGDVVIPLGAEFMKKYGWWPGDQIEWELGAGCAIMTNVTAKMRENESGFG